MIQIILNKLLTGDRNIKTELNKNSIEKLIKTSLKQKNINIDFEYLLLDNEKNNILLSNTEDDKILKSNFSISLFQNDLIDSNLVLFLDFPLKNSYLRDNNIYSLEVKKGSSIPEHNHVHEQILFVQSGKFELALEGEKITVKKNELVVIPSNKNHSGIALSDCKLIDVFTPKREEYNN